MKQIILMLGIAAMLLGCTVVPVSMVAEACTALEIAQDEAIMAPEWYVSAGKVLHACGIPGALQEGETRACFARRANGGNGECQELQKVKR
jgi:hypothetical protein